MNITCKEIRAKAKAALGNKIFKKNWLMPLLISLVVGAIIGAGATFPIVTIIIAGPFTVGLSLVYLNVVRTGATAKFEDAFSGFKKNFGQNILLGLMESIFLALWSLLLVVPGLVKMYSYSMAYYIMNDHPEYKWNECITASRKMMKGNKWKLFCLDLSFIGWIIVGSLCLGVGTLWVATYQEAARAVFYEELLAKQPVEAPVAEAVEAAE